MQRTAALLPLVYSRLTYVNAWRVHYSRYPPAVGVLTAEILQGRQNVTEVCR